MTGVSLMNDTGHSKPAGAVRLWLALECMGCRGSWRKARYLPSCNPRSLCMIFLFPYSIESFCFDSRWSLLGQIIY